VYPSLLTYAIYFGLTIRNLRKAATENDQKGRDTASLRTSCFCFGLNSSTISRRSNHLRRRQGKEELLEEEENKEREASRKT
jgi:hypothetical protein